MLFSSIHTVVYVAAPPAWIHWSAMASDKLEQSKLVILVRLQTDAAFFACFTDIHCCYKKDLRP